MGTLSDAMRRLVQEEKLGFVATVSDDGRPNLSPKGTLAVWDLDHLIFADLASPNTVRNLRTRPSVEVNVVDPFTRKGFRFRGLAQVLPPDAEGGRYLEFFARMGVNHPAERIHAVVLIRVERALPLVSPTYESGISEAEVRARWRAYYERLAAGETDLPDPA
jgi:predicted pyridoxine 5'-phosphate oxidase superfamily flavin-nucleotide-binding protein